MGIREVIPPMMGAANAIAENVMMHARAVDAHTGSRCVR